MKLEKTIYLKVETLNHHTGIITLVTPDGREVSSEYLPMDVKMDTLMGMTLRSILMRAERHYE